MNSYSNITVSYAIEKYAAEIAYTNGELQVVGYDGKFMSIILQKLGIPYKYRQSHDGTWNGVVRMLQKGEAQIAVGAFLITDERRAVIAYSPTVADVDIHFIMEDIDLSTYPLAFLIPLQSTVWIYLLMTIIISTLLITFASYSTSSFFETFWELLGNLLKQPLLHIERHRSSAVKIFLYFWWICATLLSLIYSTCLLTYLMVPPHVPRIRNFSQLASAVCKGTQKALVQRGTSSNDIILASEQPYLNKLGKEITNNNWFYDYEALEKGQIDLTNTAVISMRTTIEFVVASSPKPFFFSDDSVRTLKLALIMNKEFCCKEKVNKIITQLTRAGLYDKFVKDEMQKAGKAKTKLSLEEYASAPLNLKNECSSFFVLLFGYVLSCIVLIIEMLYFKFSNNLH